MHLARRTTSETTCRHTTKSSKWLILGRCSNQSLTILADPWDNALFRPQHACTICGRTYSHKKNLLSHQRRHNGQAFRCFEKDCDFVGASLSHLLLHQAVHSDDRPFPCDQCDAKFKYEKDLKRHRLQVHEMVSTFAQMWGAISFSADDFSVVSCSLGPAFLGLTGAFSGAQRCG